MIGMQLDSRAAAATVKEPIPTAASVAEAKSKSAIVLRTGETSQTSHAPGMTPTWARVANTVMAPWRIAAPAMAAPRVGCKEMPEAPGATAVHTGRTRAVTAAAGTSTEKKAAVSTAQGPGTIAARAAEALPSRGQRHRPARS